MGSYDIVDIELSIYDGMCFMQIGGDTNCLSMFVLVEIAEIVGDKMLIGTCNNHLTLGFDLEDGVSSLSVPDDLCHH